MKLKKLTSLVLSGAMVLGMAFFAPSKADEVSKSYFDDMKSIATWSKDDSKVDLNLKLDLTALGDAYKEFSTNYNLKLNSTMDTDANIGKLNTKFSSSVTDSLGIPEVTLFFDKNDLYVNKDVFNLFMYSSGYNKTTNKDFVKMSFDKAFANAMGVDTDFYKEILEQNASKEISEKMYNYLSKIDLGIDFGLVKNGNTYKINWNSDKIVDVTNAYVKFIFKNPDFFLKMYKEVFGIDIIAEMKKTDSTMTEAKFKKSLNDALVEWTKEVEPMLPKVKKIIAGSSITLEENFGKEEYTQKFNFKLAVDLARVSEVFEGEKYTKPMVVSATLSSNAVSKKMDKLDLTLPTNVESFDIAKFIKEEEARIQADIKKMKEEEKKLAEQGPVYDEEKPYKVTVTPATNELRVYYKGEEIAPALKLETKIVKGVLYIPTSMMEDEVLMKELDTADSYVPFKATMEKNGYKVTWDNKTKTSTATLNK